ncbi:MAG: class II glutamine amidotransferase [Proteobacteria bacterium]|nr:class II glutamine amidotransferase [Pseudomonadota bacterium]
MTCLFGCTCNQPEQLAHALAPIRSALVADPPVERWGLGYIQGGEALLSRTPRRSEHPVDFYQQLERLRSHYVMGHAAVADGLSGNVNTQPFRYRRWLFAQEGTIADISRVQDKLLDHVPGFLRRNLHGKTPAEYMFHIFLSLLHDTKSVEDPNLPLAESRRALYAAIKLTKSVLNEDGVEYNLGNITASNGRSMLAARLDKPLYMRNLMVAESSRDRTKADRDNGFRGVLLVSADTHPGEGFEEIPRESVLMVSRELRIEVAGVDS